MAVCTGSVNLTSCLQAFVGSLGSQRSILQAALNEFVSIPDEVNAGITAVAGALNTAVEAAIVLDQALSNIDYLIGQAEHSLKTVAQCIELTNLLVVLKAQRITITKQLVSQVQDAKLLGNNLKVKKDLLQFACTVSQYHSVV